MPLNVAEHSTISAGPEAMSLARDGAELRAGAARKVLEELLRMVREVAPGRAGVRLKGGEALTDLLQPKGAIGSIARGVLGRACRPVRAILFDKSSAANWALAWHQDRTICVAERVDVDGFGPWTIKADMLHVAPPFAILARMVTLRVHLDDVPRTNAPLLVAPGSHRLGCVPTNEIDAVVRRCGIRMCLAHAGDIWAYSTPILHSSEAASVTHRRRVLQVDFAGEDLPGGLRWRGL